MGIFNNNSTLFQKIALILLFTFAINSFSFCQLNPLNIGIIPAGDSIVIVYDVTINNPLPGGVTQISNQGTCSGGNFSNVLTNDPDTGPANDPTITILNMYPLPVTLTELSAFQSGNNIVLNWKVATEYNMLKYEIEKSADGRTFTKIGEVVARNSSTATQYNFLDLQPFNGINLYRLRMVDIDGTVKYSLIVKVNIGYNGQLISTFPNPVINNSFAVQFTAVKKGDYTLELFNNSGQAVFRTPLKHNGGSSTQAVFLKPLAAGAYHLRISGSGILHSETIIVK